MRRFIFQPPRTVVRRPFQGFVVAVPDLIGRYLMAPAVQWKLVGLKPTYRPRLALYLTAPAVRWKLKRYRP